MEDRPAGAGGGLRTMRRKAVETTKLVQTSFLPGREESMPIVITPAVDNVDLPQWCASHKGDIEEYLGQYGAILFRRREHFMVPGYLLEDVFDPTGAGDCFAGGFIGYLAGRGVAPSHGDLDFAELRRAVIYGSVMGSFCCEKFGVDRFRTLTHEEIEARYQEFKNCTSF